MFARFSTLPIITTNLSLPQRGKVARAMRVTDEVLSQNNLIYKIFTIPAHEMLRLRRNMKCTSCMK